MGLDLITCYSFIIELWEMYKYKELFFVFVFLLIWDKITIKSTMKVVNNTVCLHACKNWLINWSRSCTLAFTWWSKKWLMDFEYLMTIIQSQMSQKGLLFPKYRWDTRMETFIDNWLWPNNNVPTKKLAVTHGTYCSISSHHQWLPIWFVEGHWCWS